MSGKDTGLEEIAQREIGRTAVSSGQKLLLVSFFLSLIFFVPAIEVLHEIKRFPESLEVRRPGTLPEVPPGQRSFIGRVRGASKSVQASLRNYEMLLSERSFLATHLVPPVQGFLSTHFGAGNEKAVTGRSGWLYFLPGVDYAAGPGFLSETHLGSRRRRESGWDRVPQPDPLVAILHFQMKLLERGIPLLIVPTPGKAVVHPEKLSSRYSGFEEAVQNPSFARMKAELMDPELFFMRQRGLRPARDEAYGARADLRPHPGHEALLDELRAAKDALTGRRVLFFDPAPILVQEKIRTARPQYLETDTHWRPEAVMAVAARMRAFIEQSLELPPPSPSRYSREAKKVRNSGDVARMLRVPEGHETLREQEVIVLQVSQGDSLWQPDLQADILFLGDSFSNMYSDPSMGWGESGGLVEQLSYELRRPIDALLRNDNGAFAGRELLRRDLAHGNDRLAGKKLVIWQFAVRELLRGDWRVWTGPLRPSITGEKSFLSVPEGKSVIVSGVVREVSPVPRPGSSPYPDHILHVHLTDLRSEEGTSLSEDQALVALYSMRDNIRLRPASYRPGQRIRVRLHNYEEISRTHHIETVKSSDLRGGAMYEIPCWGEDVSLSGGGNSSAPR